MKYIRQIKNVYEELTETNLKDIEIRPNEKIHCCDENGYYGSCGCVYVTQYDLSKHIKYHKTQKEIGLNNVS